MPLEIPNLDNRRWADLVAEARSLIPRFAPAWTDHNVHDPGITFIELFAWLAEMQMYQLNRVGSKHRELFSHLAGVTRGARTPARVDIHVEGELNAGTFMPAGTQLVPTEGTEIVFETATDLFLTRSRLLRVVTHDGPNRIDQTEANAKPGIAFLVFGESASEKAELRLGFDEFHADEEREIRLTASVFNNDLEGRCGTEDPFRQATNQQTTAPVKLVWEYGAGADQWIEIEGVRDETAAFSQSGAITMPVPAGAVSDSGRTVWIRSRIQEGYYDIEPRLESIRLNVLPCVQRETIRGELLGKSKGKPDQTFELQKSKLAKSPVLVPDPESRSTITTSDVADWDLLAGTLEKSHAGLATKLRQTFDISNQLAGFERIKQLNAELSKQSDPQFKNLIGLTPVVITVGEEQWTPVTTFDNSGPQSRHYFFDVERYCVEFGNGLNGQIPETGQQVFAVWYQVSNGRSGNVAKDLKWKFRNNGIPGVTLTNHEPATGGTDPEPLDELELRTRALLNRPQRAVTLNDLELLALSTPNAYVARARAISNCPVPESITIVALPKIRPGRQGQPRPPSDPFIKKVERHLQQSRLICDNLRVIRPTYIEVRVSARLRLVKGASWEVVRERARLAVDRFLNGELQPADQIPAASRDAIRKASIQSPCPTRWPFGRSVFPSELYAILDGVNGVDFASDLVLSAFKEKTAVKADKTGAIPVPQVGLVFAGPHELTLEANSGRNA